jgi:SSS family solute:Na+ symporter
MMGLGSLYKYLQEVQSLLAPAIVAVFLLGIFSKKITPKAGELGIIIGFVIGMVRLVCNIFAEDLNAMEGLNGLSWFWNTNWLVFEVFLLLFIAVLMIVTSLFTSPASDEKLKGITFSTQSVEQRAETRASWTWVDVVTSLGVVAICAAFYAYFW